MVPVSLLGVGNVREAIIAVLSQDFPLSVTQLRRHMVRNLTFSVSYQAIHKEVCKLLDMRVLMRSGKDLFLNPDWIQRQKAFFHAAHENYEIGRKGMLRTTMMLAEGMGEGSISGMAEENAGMVMNRRAATRCSDCKTQLPLSTRRRRDRTKQMTLAIVQQ